MSATPIIGTLNESPLHAALKASYAANGGEAEVRMDNYVADAVRNGITYEVQTGSFSGLGKKLLRLCDHGPVVLVHPIAETSVIVKAPKTTKEKISRRRSPKHGELVHIVSELVYIPTLLNEPNFSVEVVLTEEQQWRSYDPKKRRGRGGWRVCERRLERIVDGMRLQRADDLYQFLKTDLPNCFTTKDLSSALEQPIHIAQQMAYCLRHAGVTEIVDKQGNALVYRNR